MNTGARFTGVKQAGGGVRNTNHLHIARGYEYVELRFNSALWFHVMYGDKFIFSFHWDYKFLKPFYRSSQYCMFIFIYSIGFWQHCKISVWKNQYNSGEAVHCILSEKGKECTCASKRVWIAGFSPHVTIRLSTDRFFRWYYFAPEFYCQQLGGTKRRYGS